MRSNDVLMWAAISSAVAVGQCARRASAIAAIMSAKFWAVVAVLFIQVSNHGSVTNATPKPKLFWVGP